MASFLSTALLALLLTTSAFASPTPRTCRTQPSDPAFPRPSQWAALNESVDGRLLNVVPTAKFCLERGGCSDVLWNSSVWRASVPGAMNSNNWEQDYAGNGSLCIFNSTTCGQGNVPLFAINATSPAHLQAGIRFATTHNLRLAIKASGHDFLGRSTARDSLLLWTQYFRNITFSDDAETVTVGSGVGLKDLYAATKARGRIIVGGTAWTVAAAGGYAQGGGHSAFSPVLGLAVDNAVEYNIVLANGDLIAANATSHPDLFWALRGGGAGSWGVLTSVTYRTHPTFPATLHQATFVAPSSLLAGRLLAAHAHHIPTLDVLRAGQYFYLRGAPGNGSSTLSLTTIAPHVTSGAVLAARMEPLLNAARAMGVAVQGELTLTALANDIVPNAEWAIEAIVGGLSTADAPRRVVPFQDDIAGHNVIMGSRLIPEKVYTNGGVDAFAGTFTRILDMGVPGIHGHLVAGGKVAENAHINSSVTPKWRTAKTHILISRSWPDTTAPALVEQLRYNFTHTAMPLLVGLTGEHDSGAYSSEADVREPNFQTTFYGPHYTILSAVKARYDPSDLFIVGAGVGSERWDESGMCRV
ncbi:FAD-binding domain-containing protein [Auriscalpium vulgare]|uniref:FAD-binding domain-containing protein n=1 Tax=Auriscalpium vulgare TaxID=40419 RepID=A0ACB8RY40_9AGAM|nr:FAD-binding domain-containing protein [Auriscalpium vulgare]